MCASSISLAITVIIVVLETCNVIINAVIVTSHHCYCHHSHSVLTPIIILIMFSLVLVTIIVIWLYHLLLIEMVITGISETWLAPLPTTCLVPPTQRGNIPKGTPAPYRIIRHTPILMPSKYNIL